MTDEIPAPGAFDSVMISSTFADLKDHRHELAQALGAHGLRPVVMENDAALPAGTVIDSSLAKVREAAAHIVIVSHRYGNVQESARNPERLSLTELEYREAARLGRPILVFLMGDQHPITILDLDREPDKIRKLREFRQNVIRTAESENRVYKEFNSVQEFAVAAMQSVSALRRHLDGSRPQPASPNAIPRPPELYATPPYIGSHDFVGRSAELERLGDWSRPSDPNPVLLFEAIGGSGKSMLTWHWTNEYARRARPDWAGVFWYSFYEKGAVLVDFCRQALAYMTGESLEVLNRKRQRELTERVLHQLRSRPWLVVLDGLERVLVAYHRIDAAQLRDEQAGDRDEIADRDPRHAIRPDDDDFLRLLAAARPSKLLITSRLVPRTLLNAAGRPIPGVAYEQLAGLRPSDAEELLRACGVRGEPLAMRDYLDRHCRCHPLVVGVLGGLVNDYYLDRGNFDAWAVDPEGGGVLDVGELDIVQKRNHILSAAFDALSDTSRELLSTLTLLSEPADYATLEALDGNSSASRNRSDDPGTDAHPRLGSTVKDLETRGLLQYDHAAQRFDLHPVVRAVAASRIGGADTDRFGQLVVDYFSRQLRPYETVETIDDVRDGLTVVRTLLRMQRNADALRSFNGALAETLHWKLEANAEILALLRPFFGPDWTTQSFGLNNSDFSAVASHAAAAFARLGDHAKSLDVALAALTVDLKDSNWRFTRVNMANVAITFARQNRLADSERWTVRALRLAKAIGDPAQLDVARLDMFRALAERGLWPDAENLWQLIVSGARWDYHINLYRSGDAEVAQAKSLFEQGKLTRHQLEEAEALVEGARNRPARRYLHKLRGRWLLTRSEWAGAAESFGHAIRMAREVNLSDEASECWLALANLRLDRLSDPRQEALRLSAARSPAPLALAKLWQALDVVPEAIRHALNAYRWAWADGEPYVHRYELGRAAEVLTALGVTVPVLPPYYSHENPPHPMETQIDTAIGRLEAHRNRIR